MTVSTNQITCQTYSLSLLPFYLADQPCHEVGAQHRILQVHGVNRHDLATPGNSLVKQPCNSTAADVQKTTLTASIIIQMACTILLG